jgi:DNA (cytosine-5)-methyltransferase 1
MRYFSTFTGVGGFDMGMPPDWECVGMSEIDKYANMVLKYRYRDVKNYGNIEKINYEELPDFDIQIGGSPCQDISVAGKRAGLAGLRSRLFFSYVALLKVKQPDYFIFENVKGLLSSNEGRDFAEVINQFSEAGYDIWWQVLDAADFGIPQHRERVFIFGSLGEGGFRKVFLKPENKGKDTELQRQTANTLTKRYYSGQANGSYIAENQRKAQIENLHFDRSQQNRIYGVNGVAPTLHRNTGGQQVTKIGIPVSDITHTTARQNGRRIKTKNEPSFTLQRAQWQGVLENSRIRYLTPLECERLMGWPDSWTKYGIDEKGNVVELSDNARYNLIGNGVVPQAVRAIIDNIADFSRIEVAEDDF